MAVTEEEAAWEGARAADDDLKQERTRGTKASR